MDGSISTWHTHMAGRMYSMDHCVLSDNTHYVRQLTMVFVSNCCQTLILISVMVAQILFIYGSEGR